jgi:hypothetical protein
MQAEWNFCGLWHYVPDVSTFYSHCCENIKSHRESMGFASMLSIGLGPRKIISKVTDTNSLYERWAACGMQIILMLVEIQNET